MLLLNKDYWIKLQVKGACGGDIRVRKDDKSIADIFVNGKKVNSTLVHRLNNAPSRIPTSSLGIYMSSSGINQQDR